jgi:sulfate adenylyltransferase
MFDVFNMSLRVSYQSGILFSIPVVLDTDREDISVGDKVLVTYQGQNIAVVTVESK